MRLNEYDYDERSGIRDKLEPYRGRGLWVHFTDVEKLGVNPRATHFDCPGIYFYPVDWVLDNPRFKSGILYRVNANHFFVASIDLKNSRGLDLTHATEEECRAIARQNNWLSEYDSLQSKPEISYYWKEFGRAGAMAYGIMRHLANNGRRWLSLVRGLDYIVDYSGIIYDLEEHQICVTNSRIITVMDREKLSNVSDTYPSSFKYWQKPLSKLFKRIEGALGGSTKWQDGIPTWRFDSGANWAELTWHSSKLCLVTGFENMSSRKYYDKSYLEGADEESLARVIEKTVRSAFMISAPDLKFEPVLKVDMAQHYLSMMINGGSLPKIEINPKHYVLECSKHTSLKFGGSTEAIAFINVTETMATLRYILWINKTMVISETYDVTKRNSEAIIDLEKTISQLIDRYHPSSENPLAFKDEQQHVAFARWLRFASGMDNTFRKNELLDQMEMTEKVSSIFGEA